MFFFFFKQKTAYEMRISDWSSDVCSSDLEQHFVEQFVAHAPVEALAIAILHWFAWRDVMPLQAYFAAPREHGVGGELGAVVTDDHGWLAALGDQFVQLSHNPPPGDRCVGHRTQTLPGHVIDNIEHAEAPPRDQLVVHEITAPALVWQGKDRRRRLGADSTPAIAPPPDCQPLFTIEALGFLPVDRDAVAPEQDV